jgi:hypothetical protein
MQEDTNLRSPSSEQVKEAPETVETEELDTPSASVSPETDEAPDVEVEDIEEDETPDVEDEDLEVEDLEDEDLEDEDVEEDEDLEDEDLEDEDTQAPRFRMGRWLVNGLKSRWNDFWDQRQRRRLKPLRKNKRRDNRGQSGASQAQPGRESATGGHHAAPSGKGSTVEGAGHAAFQLADIEAESLDPSDRLKDWFTYIIGVAGPFILALILSLSNGYFFAGFHDFTWGSLPNGLAYAGGVVLEAIGLAAIFRASRALKDGSRSFFWYSFGFALMLASISLLAQYMYLQLQEMQGMIAIPDSSIARIPIFNLLIGVNGMQGHDWIFLVRGSAFHLAELGCTFLISKRNKSLRRLIAQQREVQDARLTWERNELITSMENTLADQLALMMHHQRKLMNATFNRYTRVMLAQNSVPTLPAGQEQQEGVDPHAPIPLPTAANGAGGDLLALLQAARAAGMDITPFLQQMGVPASRGRGRPPKRRIP